MDGDEGKTFYVIRFLDHFFENYCIELPYQYFISFNSGLAIRSSMDPVRLLYLHDPTWTTIGSDFYTCTIRPDPTRTGDPIRRGLAIRSDYYTCLVLKDIGIFQHIGNFVISNIGMTEEPIN
jgi:hypothetical protein